MYSTNKTAWECDMAETYGIIDYESIPVRKLATLSAGLRADSRIVMEMAKMPVRSIEMFQASILDHLKWLCWVRTEDGRNNRNMPESVVDALLGRNEPKNSNLMAFDTGEEFIKERNRILSTLKE